MTRDVVHEEPTTKVRRVTQQEADELKAAQDRYEKALDEMKKRKTQDAIDKFLEASKHHHYTKSAYDLGQELLKERAFRLGSAVKSIFRRG